MKNIVQIIGYLEQEYPDLKGFLGAYELDEVLEAIRVFYTIGPLAEMGMNFGWRISDSPPEESIPYFEYKGKYYSEINDPIILEKSCTECGGKLELTPVILGCKRSNPNRYQTYMECLDCGYKAYTQIGIYQLKQEVKSNNARSGTG